MAATQDLFHLDIPDSKSAWEVVDVTGEETLDAPFRFEVTVAPRAKVGFDAVFLKTATLSWTVDDGSQRSLTVFVTEVEAGEFGWRLVLEPRVALLGDTVDHQLFIEQDTVAIVTAVLAEHAIQVESRVTRTLLKRDQCVQAFESDLEFVSRLLAEEGIAWFCHKDDKDKLVLVDSMAKFDALAGDVPVRASIGLFHAESLHESRVCHVLCSNAFSLRDYDFEAPTVTLEASYPVKPPSPPAYELYEYPGEFGDKKLGQALAQIRLEEAQTARVSLDGECTSRKLAPGYVLSLQNPPAGMAPKWLIVSLSHETRQGWDHGESGAERAYRARFRAIPADVQYRPARLPTPKLGGIQTGTITGPAGGEIHPDKHGRVKVRLRWDRRRSKDDTSSNWARVVQPSMSGSFQQPRVGWENLVGFWDASADYPIVLWRLHNGGMPAPHTQPANKVVTAYGTSTTPGGGSLNHFTMTDTKGAESFDFNASKDYNEKTENDKAALITANDTWNVAGDSKVITQQVYQVGVKGSQTYSVGGSRTVNVTANKVINAGSETVSIGAARVFNVGGDQHIDCASLVRVIGSSKGEADIEHHSRLVTGATGVIVGGAWNAVAGLHASAHVGGVNTESVAGAKSIAAPKYDLKVKGAVTETYSSRKITAGNGFVESAPKITYDVSGAAKVNGSSFVVFEASSKLTLKGGGVTVTITSSDVKIDGKFDNSDSSEDKEENYG
jgi:type VI secretion system secreted protein VgrG